MEWLSHLFTEDFIISYSQWENDVLWKSSISIVFARDSKMNFNMDADWKWFSHTQIHLLKHLVMLYQLLAEFLLQC